MSVETKAMAERARSDSTARRLAAGKSPVIGVALSGVALVFLVVPVLGILLKAPWSEIPSLLTDTEVLQALKLSLWTSLLTTAIALLIGVPLAVQLSRSNGRIGAAMRAGVVLPLVLPPVVAGVALLVVFGRSGIVGSSLDTWFGITIPFTSVAVVLAQLFVSMPFLVITVEGALRARGQGLEEAARSLGASRGRVLMLITIPAARSAIIAGAALCWARALGEFGATVTFAGSFPGVTQTLPIEVYFALQAQPQRAIAVSVLLIVVCAVVLFALRRSWTGRLVSNG